MGKFDNPKPDLLRSIADALGVSVERFFVGNSPGDVASYTDDCLRLWSRIKTDEGRARALRALQAIADEEVD